MAGVSENRRTEARGEQPRYDMARLRYEFIKSQLDVSVTLASFTFARPDKENYGERLNAACKSAALKGYRSASLCLVKADLPLAERAVLRTKLEHLRKILPNQNAVEHQGTADSPPSNGHESWPNGHLNGRAANGQGEPRRRDGLTPREREVLRCIAEGNSTKEVAGLLGITFKTASCHRSRIMDKLGIHNLAGLVHYAIRERIVQP